MLLLDPIEIMLVVNLTVVTAVATAGYFWQIRAIKDLNKSLSRRLDQLELTSEQLIYAAGVAEERARQRGSRE